MTPATPTYTSRIIKAGALLADTKILLTHWDTSKPINTNLTDARQTNVFGKASRSRVADILAIFRQRYLVDPIVAKALVTLAQGGLTNEILDRILYFHATQSDPLLHDTVIHVLQPRHHNGRRTLSTDDVQEWLRRQIAEGKTATAWSGTTTNRAARELLSTLRDFGLLQGAVKKQVAPVFLPIEAFAYIAFYLHHYQRSGHLLLDNPEWQLFFLSRSVVERFLIEAQQHRLLHYYAAGSIVRLTFPAQSLDEYAHVILDRTVRPT
jgi:hypothetical protein